MTTNQRMKIKLGRKVICSSEPMKARRKRHKGAEGKELSPRICHPVKMPLRPEGGVKTPSDEGKLGELVPYRSALRRWFGVLSRNTKVRWQFWRKGVWNLGVSVVGSMKALPVADCWPPVFSHGTGTEQLSFIRASTSFTRTPPCNLTTSQRPHHLTPSCGALRFQRMDFGRSQTFRT